MEFKLINEVKRMAEQEHFWSKAKWKQMVWGRAWQVEEETWDELKPENRFFDYESTNI